MGVLTLFLIFIIIILVYFILGRSHIDWPITNFFGTLVTPNRSTSVDPKLQNRNKRVFFPYDPHLLGILTFSVYIHGS
jgi:hypothetical protein